MSSTSLARLVLDTHVLLWALGKPERLPASISAAIVDAAADVFFSAASIWEIAIKHARQRPDFEAEPAEVVAAAVEMGLVELPVTAAAAGMVATLPRLRRDPFDRLLIAQAMQLPAYLITADRALVGYSDLVKAFDPRRG